MVKIIIHASVQPSTILRTIKQGVVAGGGGFNALKILSNNQSLVSHSSCRVMRCGLFTFSLLERTNQSIFMAICATLPGAGGGGKQVSSSRKRSFILISRLN